MNLTATADKTSIPNYAECGLLLLMILCTLSYGLGRSEAFWVFATFLCVALAACWGSNSRLYPCLTVIDLSFAVLAFVYGALAVRGLFPRIAWFKAYRLALAFLIYLWISRRPEHRHQVRSVFIFTMVLLSAVGACAYFGLFSLPGAIWGSDRLASVFYPNALAVFTAAAVIFADLHSHQQPTYVQRRYGAAAGLLVWASFAAKSRAGLAVAIVGAVVYLVTLPQKRRLHSVARIGCTGLIGLLAATWGLTFLYHPLGMIMPVLAAVFGGLCWSAISRVRLESVGGYRMHTLAWSLTGVAMVALVVLAGSSGVLARFRLGLTDPGRLYMWRDGLSLFLAHPLGLGGGEWDALFPTVQMAFYESRYVHSVLIQVAVEAGVVGLASLILLVTLAVRGFMLLRHDPEVVATGAALCIVFGHSLIDMDLVSGAALFWMSVLLGVLRSHFPEARQRFEPARSAGSAWFLSISLPAAAIAVLCVALTFPALSFVSATIYGSNARAAAAAGLPDRVERYYRLAAVLNPANGEYRIGHAEALVSEALVSGDPTLMQQGLDEARLATRLEPHNEPLWNSAAGLFLSAGECGEAVAIGERLAEFQPLSGDSWDYYLTILYAAARNRLRVGDATEARSLLGQIVSASLERAAVADGQAANEREFRLQPTSPETMLRVAQAKALLGQPSEAEKELSSLLASPVRSDASVWLALLYSSDGSAKQAATILRPILSQLPSLLGIHDDARQSLAIAQKLLWPK